MPASRPEPARAPSAASEMPPDRGQGVLTVSMSSSMPGTSDEILNNGYVMCNTLRTTMKTSTPSRFLRHRK